MAQKRSITPEKQLLGLIENSKSTNASVVEKAVRYRSLSLFSASAWLSRLAFLKDRFQKKFTSGAPMRLDIKIANRVLIGCVAALMVYFVVSLAMSVLNMKKFPNMALKPQEDMKLSIFPDILPLKGAAYMDKIRQRDIFKMGAKPPEAKTADAPKVSQSKIMEATQHLKLVGISWSNDPDVMIEDSKSMRTFFVKRGQMIGDVKVQAVSKNKVILRYQGEDVELN